MVRFGWKLTAYKNKMIFVVPGCIIDYIFYISLFSEKIGQDNFAKNASVCQDAFMEVVQNRLNVNAIKDGTEWFAINVRQL